MDTYERGSCPCPVNSERVTHAEVVRTWLARERRKRDAEPPDSGTAVGPMLDELLGYQPGAASVLWRDAPFQWRKLNLERVTFDQLHVVEGPSALGWRALASDGRVTSIAAKLADLRPIETDLIDSPGLDLACVRHLCDEGTRIDDPLVVTTRPGDVPLYIADGNHRAVAYALGLVEGRTYEPVPAFVGTGSAPVFARARERFRGWVHGSGYPGIE